MTHPDDAVRLAAFLLVALLLCVLDKVRRRAEEALRHSEALYRQFFQDALTGDFIATPQGELLLCNAAFARMFGFASPEEALSAQKVILFPDKRVREEYLALLRAGQRPPVHERELARPDGKTLVVLENLVGLLDAGGELVQLQGYLLDPTERRQAEELKAQLAAIVESSEDAIISKSRDGRIVR